MRVKLRHLAISSLVSLIISFSNFWLSRAAAEFRLRGAKTLVADGARISIGVIPIRVNRSAINSPFIF